MLKWLARALFNSKYVPFVFEHEFILFRKIGFYSSEQWLVEPETNRREE